MAIVPNLAFPADISDDENVIEFHKSLPDPHIETYDTEGSTNIIASDGAPLASGSVELTGGASGSVDGIEVNGVEVMSGAEAFDSDLATTAANVAANITANTSDPNYNATADGAVITVEAVDQGIAANGFTVVASTTTITTDDTAMSGGEDHLSTDSRLPTITYNVA